jgi:cob(I)alamin adenosyltransferase|tara:strand:- start:77 stop:244 length:168 start_codon:yes stop_codon:yes gene_type:complete
MGINTKIKPKDIKYLERAIDKVRRKKRPVRAEVMPTTVPAWGSMRKEERDEECED